MTTKRRIRALDQHSYTVEVMTPRGAWEPKTYWTSLTSAAKGLLEAYIRDNEEPMYTLADIKAHISQALCEARDAYLSIIPPGTPELEKSSHRGALGDSEVSCG